MADASTAFFPSIRTYAKETHEKALPFITELVASPPWPLAGAAAEALGEIPVIAAAELARTLASVDRPREVRRGARRALHRLKQAGLDVDTGVRGDLREETVTLKTSGPAFLSSCDPAGARMFWMMLEIPGTGRSTANGVIQDTDRLESFTITQQSRGEFGEEIIRARQAMEGNGSFLIDEVPTPYLCKIITSAAETGKAGGRGVSTDYAVHARYLAVPDDPPPSPVYAHLRATDVRFRPDLLDRSPEVLDESEMQSWHLPEETVELAKVFYRERRTSTLTLPPEAERDRLQAIIHQIAEKEFGGASAARWRGRLEEMAYHFVCRDRQGPARLALAAGLAFDGTIVNDHPWMLRLLQKSVARSLGVEPAEFQRQQGALAGLWAPRTDASGERTMAGHEARPSGLIIPRR